MNQKRQYAGRMVADRLRGRFHERAQRLLPEADEGTHRALADGLRTEFYRAKRYGRPHASI